MECGIPLPATPLGSRKPTKMGPPKQCYIRHTPSFADQRWDKPIVRADGPPVRIERHIHHQGKIRVSLGNRTCMEVVNP